MLFDKQVLWKYFVLVRPYDGFRVLEHLVEMVHIKAADQPISQIKQIRLD